MYFDFSPQWIRGIKGLSTDLPVGVNELPPLIEWKSMFPPFCRGKGGTFTFCFTTYRQAIAGQLIQHLQYKCTLGIKKFHLL